MYFDTVKHSTANWPRSVGHCSILSQPKVSLIYSQTHGDETVSITSLMSCLAEWDTPERLYGDEEDFTHVVRIRGVLRHVSLEEVEEG
jgi:hypothetical protein